ncbi:MAG: hypothetical protein JWR69_1174 [Pedosphaera sp.]|nr:hypothetical protein [Pedosphaera sp.]
MGLGIKTWIQFILKETFGGGHGWFSAAGDYETWQQNRIKSILKHYSADFFDGKTIIELGAGYGDIGRFFHQLGAKVTFIEGRKENVTEIQRRYPSMRVLQWDLNDPLPPTADKADIIIHFGLLYHLGNPEASLRNSCRACQYMMLETECCDSDDPNFVRPVKEKAYWKDHALNGEGCSPSPAFVERTLTEEGMEFERVTDARCNGGEHFYDWPIKNTGITKKGQRKFWFVKKKAH